MTLMQQPNAAAVLSVSTGEWLLGAPTAAPDCGTAVSAAVRVRHTGTDAFAFDVVSGAVAGTADAVAPPPRGAPV